MWLGSHLLTEVDSTLDQVVLVVARVTLALHHVVAQVLEELAIITRGRKSSARGWLEGAVMVGVAPKAGISLLVRTRSWMENGVYSQVQV